MGWAWAVWIAVAVILLLIVAWRLSYRAGRLDRLHRRMDAARASLNNSLMLRSSVAADVAGRQMPDKDQARTIADATQRARRLSDATDEERGLAESELTRALSTAFADEEAVAAVTESMGSSDLMDELGSATRRVEMSRRFYNDAVRATTAVRQQKLVRWFRLAGHTPWPHPFEMDDGMPTGFGMR